MARWGLKNYNIFIREARAAFGFTAEAARAAYRTAREIKGAPVFSSDLRKNSSVRSVLETIPANMSTGSTKAQRASTTAAKGTGRGTGTGTNTGTAISVSGAQGRGLGRIKQERAEEIGGGRGGRSINSASALFDYFEEYEYLEDDYDWYEYDSTADYLESA